MSTYCQNCHNEVPITYPFQIGKIVECPTCRTKYEVVWLYPLELAPCPNPFPPTEEDLSVKKKSSDES